MVQWVAETCRNKKNCFAVVGIKNVYNKSLVFFSQSISILRIFYALRREFLIYGFQIK
jgi:hypothetical protein